MKLDKLVEGIMGDLIRGLPNPVPRVMSVS